MKIFPALLLASCVAATARAESTPNSTGLGIPLSQEAVVDPGWRETPSGDEVSAVYPRIANMLELSGRAEMACVAEPDGSVDQCRVTSEAPAGLGFGAAALRLAPIFKMRPKTVGSVAVKGKVTVPIRFSMTSGDALPRPGPCGAFRP